MRPIRKFILPILLVLILVSLHVMATRNIHAFRNSLKYRNHIEAPLLPESLMCIVCGEFKGISSDFLLLEISAFINGMGTQLTPEDWDRVSFHFSQTMALDPYFKQTYQMVQSFLPWSNKAKEANDLLEKAREHLPWDWNPAYYIGFNNFYFLHDSDAAAHYLLEASKIPGAPAMLATLGARMAQEAGRTGAAIVILRTMLHNPDYSDESKRLIEARIQLLESVLVIERAIQSFEKSFGHKPDRLEDLVKAGLLDKLPKNAEGRYFTYNDGKLGY